MKITINPFQVIPQPLRGQKATIPLAALLLLSLAGIAQAQSTAFTYQGRVLDNGTNFTGTGQFKFALVTSAYIVGSQATATAIMGGTSPHEFVSGYNIVSGGSGYTTVPNVTVSPPGGPNSTATAQATISGGSVTAVTEITPGSGYSSAPAVTIDPPTPYTAYTTYWSNDGTSVNGSQPTAAVSVSVNNGLFTVALGNPALPNMTVIPPAVFTTQTGLQLLLWFNDGVNGFALLIPPQALTSVPCAVMANSASNLLGTLPTAQLNGTIPVSQLSGTPGAATNFTGSLSGNVTGTQTATVVATVGGQSAANVASGASAANAATSLNTGNAIVKRDGSGNFSAGSVTLAGNLNLPGAGTIYSGGNALIAVYGTQNFFASRNAGNPSVSGINNIGIGVSALYNDTTGQNNVGIGAFALNNNTSGLYNVAVGPAALQDNFSGAQNVAIGANALSSLGYSNGVGGSNNIALGYFAGGNFSLGESYNIDIGNQGYPNENNTIRIGTPGTQTATYIAGISGATASGGSPVYVTSSGQLGTVTSSARFKQNIQSMGEGSDALMSLHPVTFQYKPEIDSKGLAQFGLIAEEVDKVNPDLVVHDDAGKPYTVRYEAVNAMLLNEFLKEHRKVGEQGARINDLNARLERLERLLTERNGGVK